jgi:hypothetical protein
MLAAMSSSEAPRDEDELDPLDPGDAGAEPTTPSTRPDPDVRIGLDRILPELIRKGFEAGRGPLERVSESIFPKDIASHLVTQLGDIRSGVVKAVAQEVGRFLREADIASEVRKVLTGLDIDAQVKLRFTAREDGAIKPEVELNLDSKERPRDKRKK